MDYFDFRNKYIQEHGEDGKIIDCYEEKALEITYNVFSTKIQELESQIEKMKCVENCKNSRNRDKCFTDCCPCKNWELK